MKLARVNWTSLNEDVMSLIFPYMTFKEIAKCSEINQNMHAHVHTWMKRLLTIDTTMNVESTDYIINKCESMNHWPTFSQSNYTSLKKLLKRWPNELNLVFDIYEYSNISAFYNQITSDEFSYIDNISIKVNDDRIYDIRQLKTIRFKHLTNLSIDAEGCNLEAILTRLHCNNWYVKNLYLRGDVHDLSSILLYSPEVSESLKIINTNDSFDPYRIGTEHAIKFIIHLDLQRVELSNIIIICCYPPSACHFSDLFIYAVESSLYCSNCRWQVERLGANMIEVLLEKSMSVQCAVFDCEMHQVNSLMKKYPNKIDITCVI